MWSDCRLHLGRVPYGRWTSFAVLSLRGPGRPAPPQRPAPARQERDQVPAPSTSRPAEGPRAALPMAADPRAGDGSAPRPSLTGSTSVPTARADAPGAKPQSSRAAASS
ncbi:choline binding protein A [Streptomyces azureus]|uniref:Choline binding protein A n=1 Tax=Streptomyces azureus TaxID=146537 RepID=A0A0K8PHC5_STRAJ|nr:choline binding protein A [Streptomyces azureus]